MRLDVPLIRQEKDSIDCGLAGLSMLFKYYGIEKGIPELKKEIKIYEKMGTYIPQLGSYLIKNGFEVEIITINPYLFTYQFREKSKEDLVNYLQEVYEKTENEKFKEPLMWFKEFINAGGKLTIKVPTAKDIQTEIANGRPLIALITSNFLLFEKPSFNFHFNLVTGIDDSFIYVNDPMWDYRGGCQKYPISDFFYALYASAHGDLDNASVMRIKKK